MGNTQQQKYFSIQDAVDALGNEKWNFIRNRLSRSTNAPLDFATFYNILTTKFQQMPEEIAACLFRAFANDVNQKVDLETFACGIAVVFSRDRIARLRVAYRVYADNTGLLTRYAMERILYEVHGKDKIRGNKWILRMLENLFTSPPPPIVPGTGRRGTTHYPQEIALNLKDFEAWYNCTGAYAVVSGSGTAGANIGGSSTLGNNTVASHNTKFLNYLDEWIRKVFSIFYEPLPLRLQALHRRYEITVEAEEVIDQFSISRDLYDKLKDTFAHRFSDPYKLHITPIQWKSWLSPFYLQESLAMIIFESRLDHLKVNWKFIDFADFVLSYSSPMIELRCQAIVTAFLKIAIRLGGSNSNHPDGNSDSSSYQLEDDDREVSDISGITCYNPSFELFLVEYLVFMVYLLSIPADYSLSDDDHDDDGLHDSTENDGNTKRISVLDRLLYQTLDEDDIVKQGARRQGEMDERGNISADAMLLLALGEDEANGPPEGDKEDDGEEVENDNVDAAPTPSGVSGNAKSDGSTKIGLTAHKPTHHSHRRDVRSFSLNLSFGRANLGSTGIMPSGSWTGNNSQFTTSSSVNSKTGDVGTRRRLSGIDVRGLWHEIERSKVVPAKVKEELRRIMLDNTQSAESYVRLLIQCYHLLPGMRDLSLTSCVLFGVIPASPREEKELVTEVTIRYMKAKGCGEESVGSEKGLVYGGRPFGGIDTEWELISKVWVEGWKRFVGRHQASEHYGSSNNSSVGVSGGGGGLGGAGSGERGVGESVETTISPSTSTHGSRGQVTGAPGPIDNNSLMRSAQSSRALAPGLVSGQHFEAIPPPAYDALHAWYGGGPIIRRRVAPLATPIPLSSSQSLSVSHSQSDDNERDRRRDSDDDEESEKERMNTTSTNVTRNLPLSLDVEYYPLAILLVTCDNHGRTIASTTGSSVNGQEMLFSRTLTVSDCMAEIALYRGLDVREIRLWNYGKTHWRDQHILSPELTLAEAGLVDGQTILIERSLDDGTWPRSQMHSILDGEEQQLISEREKEKERMLMEREKDRERERERGIALEEADQREDDEREGKERKTTVITEKDRDVLILPPVNDGHVGLDNLGNTCYLNSSLQVLLHLDLLMQYFLSGRYKRHVNIFNKHGYHGRIAHIFGRISLDLWTTRRTCITPRYFLQEIAALRDQFAGNEQHDAHELLAFLLDGLSEDLNLVHKKPYIEQPDSDGRPDSTLADIWWSNHLQRDNSIIQSLFSGQFKSIMTCSLCQYSSARYEPFTYLSIPIPDERERALTIMVVPRKHDQLIRVAVRVPINGRVEDIVRKVIELKVGHEGENDEPFLLPDHYLIGEQHNGRVRKFVPLDKKIETVMDKDILYLFEVEYRSSWVKKHGGNANPALAFIPPIQLTSVSSSESLSPMKGKDYNERERTKQSTREKENRREEDDDNDNDNDDIMRESEELKKQREELKEKELIMLRKRFPLRATLIDNISPLVRVALSQRRIVFQYGEEMRARGYDSFKLETCGSPILEILPSRMCGSDLYRIVHTRFAKYFRGSVMDLMQRRERGKHPSSSSLNNNNRNEKETENSSGRGSSGGSGNKTTMTTVLPNGYHYESSAKADTLSYMNSELTEEVMAGPIPSKGFTLRAVTGGDSETVVCSFCNWLSRCDGCTIPDRDDCIYTLRDGETIAVDWHYEVYEELLDRELFSQLIEHSSCQRERVFLYERKIPLQSCLEKFSESECLEDVICPKCRGNGPLKEGQKLDEMEIKSGSIRKRFMLWRLPPILIIQLKRFQFTRFSKKKLSQKIDFPHDNLDLSPYCATGSVKGAAIAGIGVSGKGIPVLSNPPSIGKQQEGEGEGESSHEGEDVIPIPEVITSGCSEYSLASTIHHIGVMGGGHYTACVRTSLGKEGDDGNSNTSGKGKNREQWVRFNDHLVTDLKNPDEANVSSAYVLFFVRKDCLGKQVTDFFDPVMDGPTQDSLLANMNNGGDHSGGVAGASMAKANQTSRSNDTTESQGQSNATRRIQRVVPGMKNFFGGGGKDKDSNNSSHTPSKQQPIAADQQQRWFTLA